MMADSKREFDLLIFGASGFTGYYLVRELVLTLGLKKFEEEEASSGSENSGLRWAVAGRSLAKLESTLGRLAGELKMGDEDLLNKKKLVLANVLDGDSLSEMAKKTRVLVNLAGPYTFSRRPVVEACVSEGTHYLDLGGDVEGLVESLDQKAKKSGSLVVTGCGWDSLSGDVAIQWMKKQFKGRLAQVDTVAKVQVGEQGYRLPFGAYQSAIRHLGCLFSSSFLLSQKGRAFSSCGFFASSQAKATLSGWNVPFPWPFTGSANRTQLYNEAVFSEPPVQVLSYINFNQMSSVLKTVLSGLILVPLSMFPAGQYLLEQYPAQLTFGWASKEGPSREQIEATRTVLYLFGRGWAEGEADKDKQSPKSTMTVLVSGRDPACLATATCAIQAALTLVEEPEKVAKGGGILTPGSAFRETKLVERLQAREMSFQIVDV